jgi:1-acyl-sn-glycerol-3-phosphate acyltransferase
MTTFLRKIWYFTVVFILRIALYFFYKKITVTGRNQLPKNVPLLFAANHENAFIDAFLIGTHNSNLINTLVRADVFKYTVIRLILSSMNMLPVYRIRDGFSSIKDNDKIFEACYEAFGNGESLIIFPEASHDARRYPRKITKGVSRVALGAVNSKYDVKDLYVVPVGLDYSDHKRFRAEVQLNYGEPIPIEKKALEIKNYDHVKNEIEAGMRKMHIGLPKENYDLLDNLFFGIEGKIDISNYKQINADASIVNQAIKEFDDPEALKKHSQVFTKYAAKFGTKSFGSHNLFIRSFISLFALPLFILGAVLNGIVLAGIFLFDKALISDKVFIGPINYMLGLIFLPILWYQQYKVYVGLYGQDVYAILFAISMPISLILFQIIKDYYRKVIGHFMLALDKKSAQAFSESRQYLKEFKTSCLTDNYI